LLSGRSWPRPFAPRRGQGSSLSVEWLAHYARRPVPSAPSRAGTGGAPPPLVVSLVGTGGCRLRRDRMSLPRSVSPRRPWSSRWRCFSRFGSIRIGCRFHRPSSRSRRSLACDSALPSPGRSGVYPGSLCVMRPPMLWMRGLGPGWRAPVTQSGGAVPISACRPAATGAAGRPRLYGVLRSHDGKPPQTHSGNMSDPRQR